MTVYIDGRPEELIPLRIVVPESRLRPCFVTSQKLSQVQATHWLTLKVTATYWVPDLSLARRIQSLVRQTMAPMRLRSWYNVEPDVVEGVLLAAARSQRIPLVTDAQYQELRPTREAHDAAVLQRARRS